MISSATILGLDYVSGGNNWRDQFVRSGYVYNNNSGTTISSLPSWISSVVIKTYVDATPRIVSQGYAADAQRLQYHDKSGYTTFSWVGNTQSGLDDGGFWIYITTTSYQPTLLSLYSVDADSLVRRNQLSFWSLDKSTQLSATLTADRTHRPGAWYRGVFSGSVAVLLRKNVGANGIITGLAFDAFTGKIGLSGGAGSYTF